MSNYLVKRDTHEQQVLKAMMDGKERHLIDVCHLTGLKDNQVSTVLVKLNRKGKLKRTEPGRYLMPKEWIGRHALRNGS